MRLSKAFDRLVQAHIKKHGMPTESHYTKVVVARRSKFGNVKTRGFASTREADRYSELRLMLSAKAITDLRYQVKFEVVPAQYDYKGKLIERAVSYIADFTYRDVTTKKTVVEDTKGHRTKDYIIKRKLMLHVYGVRVVEV